MAYGLPYKGSKSKLAERLVDLFPKAEHFYDLFSGGCAVSHCALSKNKFSYIHMNDINPMMPKAFCMALNGEFSNEDRWISREDFFRLKETDPYAAICFSFGNNLKTYAYSREIEPKKKALHYAIFFDDFTLSDEEFGIDLRPISALQDRRERYLQAKILLHSTPPRYAMARKNAGCKTWKGNSGCGDCSKKTRFDLQNAEGLQRLSLAKYAELQPPHFTPPRKISKKSEEVTLAWSAKDYQDVEIQENSVIYCDIPYKDTSTYAGKGASFDYERFYEWCLRQKHPLFISSYEMPKSDFKVVAEFTRRDTLSATNNSKLVVERVFMPRMQETRGNIQLSLF